MVQVIKNDVKSPSTSVFIFAGLSSDTKPTVTYDHITILTGSRFFVVGGSSYTYDEENHAWVEDVHEEGGGGGTAAKTLNDVLTSIVTGASQYLATNSYFVGDYVIKENILYKCNTPIVGGETWNASHWDAMPPLQNQLDNTETWTFTLSDNTTVTKKVVVR